MKKEFYRLNVKRYARRALKLVEREEREREKCATLGRKNYNGRTMAWEVVRVHYAFHAG